MQTIWCSGRSRITLRRAVSRRGPPCRRRTTTAAPLGLFKSRTTTDLPERLRRASLGRGSALPLMGRALPGTVGCALSASPARPALTTSSNEARLKASVAFIGCSVLPVRYPVTLSASRSGRKERRLVISVAASTADWLVPAPCPEGAPSAGEASSRPHPTAYTSTPGPAAEKEHRWPSAPTAPTAMTPERLAGAITGPPPLFPAAAMIGTPMDLARSSSSSRRRSSASLKGSSPPSGNATAPM
jgi:hypothetical protein